MKGRHADEHRRLTALRHERGDHRLHRVAILASRTLALVVRTSSRGPSLRSGDLCDLFPDESSGPHGDRRRQLKLKARFGGELQMLRALAGHHGAGRPADGGTDGRARAATRDPPDDRPQPGAASHLPAGFLAFPAAFRLDVRRSRSRISGRQTTASWPSG